MSPRVGWNRKGVEIIYVMCVGPAMFLVLLLTLHTCEIQLSCVLLPEAALVNSVTITFSITATLQVVEVYLSTWSEWKDCQH